MAKTLVTCLAVWLVACASRGSRDAGAEAGPPDLGGDAAVTDLGAASTDASRSFDGGDAACGASVEHYEPCTCTAQCPAGNQCVALITGMGSFCAPDCAGADGTTCDPAAPGASVCVSHHCALYCDRAGIVARCASTCIPFSSGSGDGLCAPTWLDAGMPSDTDAGPSCAPVVEDGTTLSWGTAPGPLPPGTGGTIMPGHYVLVAATTYLGSALRPPPSSITEAMDVTVAAMSFAWVNGSEMQLATTYARSSTTTLTLSPAPCSHGAPPPETVGYTATSMQLVIEDPGGDGSILNSFAAYDTEYTFQLR